MTNFLYGDDVEIMVIDGIYEAYSESKYRFAVKKID